MVRDDGRRLDARVLSQGTFDQLYLSIRLALAREVLGDEPGFLILDDPLIAADKERMLRCMDVLVRLAGEGWSILYFTSKAEIGEDVAPRLGLRVRELPALP